MRIFINSRVYRAAARCVQQPLLDFISTERLAAVNHEDRFGYSQLLRISHEQDVFSRIKILVDTIQQREIILLQKSRRSERVTHKTPLLTQASTIRNQNRMFTYNLSNNVIQPIELFFVHILNENARRKQQCELRLLQLMKRTHRIALCA